jgi:hypothetical protein
MSFSSSKAMIFVVISLLAIALIFGSIFAFNAFAKHFCFDYNASL